MSSKPDYAIAVDIGGTFTDITLADRASGQLWQVKTPTTPADQSEAFANGIGQVLGLAGIKPGDIESVFHGTTVATNAILERKGALVGLIVTDGCRYVLHIGRHDVAKDAFSYTWIRPPRLVPPRRIQEVVGRLGPDGSVETPLDESACRDALKRLAAQKIESLAVCLLHSYAHAGHEERVRAMAAEVMPGVPCSISAEVLPVFREYERMTATVINAYVMPQVAGYHHRLEARMENMALSAPLRIMKSNGGMYSAKSAAKHPIHTALSGPAAAVVGAILVGRAAGQPNIISIDVGGTSADICLSKSGEPAITTGSEIAGLPLNVPMVDVHTIGAGGGSIARVGGDGGLKVGPESAGSLPGPACYRRGGTEPTVTDANLALGRTPAKLSGGVELDVDAAAKAITTKVADTLGLTLHQAADGIVELLNNNMAAAIRAVSVERGYDPREFALVAGGGGGALHAGRLAELLGIPLVVVPASAGLLSTIGLLATDLKADFVQTRIRRIDRCETSDLDAMLGDLEGRAMEWAKSEGVAPADARLARYAGLRYVHQAYEVTVPMPEDIPVSGERMTPEFLSRLVERFHAEHERLFSWSSKTLPVEFVNVGVTAYGRLNKISMAKRGAGAGVTPKATTRDAYFGGHGVVKTPVIDFDTLSPGWHATGPAVIEQRFSTILVMPGHEARMDDYGNILMETKR